MLWHLFWTRLWGLQPCRLTLWDHPTASSQIVITMSYQVLATICNDMYHWIIMLLDCIIIGCWLHHITYTQVDRTVTTRLPQYLTTWLPQYLTTPIPDYLTTPIPYHPTTPISYYTSIPQYVTTGLPHCWQLCYSCSYHYRDNHTTLLPWYFQ